MKEGRRLWSVMPIRRSVERSFGWFFGGTSGKDSGETPSSSSPVGSNDDILALADTPASPTTVGSAAWEAVAAATARAPSPSGSRCGDALAMARSEGRRLAESPGSGARARASSRRPAVSHSTSQRNAALGAVAKTNGTRGQLCKRDGVSVMPICWSIPGRRAVFRGGSLAERRGRTAEKRRHRPRPWAQMMITSLPCLWPAAPDGPLLLGELLFCFFCSLVPLSSPGIASVAVWVGSRSK